jgi:type I restriction-modification system DNA methylase subunit
MTKCIKEKKTAVASPFQEIADRLWEAADKLRANTHLRASEYAVPLLGLVFLKFADQKFAEAERRLRASGQEATPERVSAERAISLAANPRFSYLRTLSKHVGPARIFWIISKIVGVAARTMSAGACARRQRALLTTRPCGWRGRGCAR